jgi:PAS domain S-box-containing protein
MESKLARLVDELRQSQAALDKEAQRFQAVLKTASDGIHVLDVEGNLVEASASFLRKLGCSQAEAATLCVSDWDVQCSKTGISTLFSKVLTEPVLYETKYRRRDGSTLDVEISAHRVEFDGRNYVYASARDITNRKLAEADTVARHSGARVLPPLPAADR